MQSRPKIRRPGNNPMLSICFWGRPARGRRLQALAAAHGWRLCNLTAPAIHAQCAAGRPDLVILDGFPESEAARTAFFQLQTNPGLRFLALSATPHARELSRVRRLSFMHIIDRDPGPEAFTRAVLDLARSQRQLSPPPPASGLESKRTIYRLTHPGDLQGQACC